MITVHMTTHRRLGSGLLERAVRSVLDQSYEDIELVVCDDASRDGTAGYLAELSRRDPRVRIVTNERNVNNVAVSLARCLLAADPGRPYLTWMFDDCVLRPGALEVLARRLDGDPGLDFAYGTTVVHRGAEPPLLVGAHSAEHVREHIHHRSVLVPNAGILLRRSLFDRVGWFDPNVLLRRSCDWDLFRRAIHEGAARFAVLDQQLCDEWGEEQPDSLRNSFTTDFGLMQKYVVLRAEAGWDLSLDSALHHPVDRLPFGTWTPEEVRMCRYVALEYFLSVGEMERAKVWADRLASTLERVPFFVENLAASGVDDPQAVGAYCGVVWGSYWADQAGWSVPLRKPRPPQSPRVVQRAASLLRTQPLLFRLGQRAWHAARPVVVRPRRPA